MAETDAFRKATIAAVESRIQITSGALLRAVAPTPPTDATERLIFALAVAEVRRELASVPELERTALYRSAHGNRYVAAAVETDAPPALSRVNGMPRFDPLVSSSVVTECQLARAREAGKPEDVLELADLERLLGVYRTAGGLVEKGLFGRLPELRKEREEVRVGDRSVNRVEAEREMRLSPTLTLS